MVLEQTLFAHAGRHTSHSMFYNPFAATTIATYIFYETFAATAIATYIFYENFAATAIGTYGFTSLLQPQR